jgi:hypothetical protein
MTMAQIGEWLFGKEGCRFMQWQEKSVTRKLVRKHFGQNAGVRGFGGCYTVTTPTGGKVVITPGKIKIVYGGDDVYSAVVLLVGECWGAGKVSGRVSRESMLAYVAHGEACGVRIEPNFRNRWATFARWVVAILLFYTGLLIFPPEKSTGIEVVTASLLPALVFGLMKRNARRKEQRKLETGGFLYPRTTQGAHYADEEQLGKGGLI